MAVSRLAVIGRLVIQGGGRPTFTHALHSRPGCAALLAKTCCNEFWFPAGGELLYLSLSACIPHTLATRYKQLGHPSGLGLCRMRACAHWRRLSRAR